MEGSATQQIAAAGAPVSERAAEPPGDEAWVRSVRIARWAVGVVVAVMYAPPVWSVGLRTDLGAHLVIAEQMSLTGSTPPYSLFHQITIAVRTFLPFEPLALLDPTLSQRATTWEVSGVVVIVASAVATALIVLARLLRAAPQRRTVVWLSAAATVGLMVATPVTVLTWSNQQMLAGYVPLTSYHNPTMMISRPFALVLFGLLAARLHGRADRRTILVTAAASALVVAGKPSYAICLLPAAGLLVVWDRPRWRAVDWRFLVLGAGGPALLMAAFQLARVEEVGGLDIALAPFAVLQTMLGPQGQSAWWFAPFVVLSLLFPLSVALCCGRGVRSTTWTLAWAALVIGTAYFCLFEITSFEDPGDFLWGAQVASFVLFVEATRLALRRLWFDGTAPALLSLRLRRAVVGTTFGLHVACGVAFAVLEVLHPAEWW